MMGYLIGSVEITSFDVHIAFRPLQVPESMAVQDSCRFLVRSSGYRDQYASQRAVETPHFQIGPLNRRELVRGHFWKRFNQTWLEESGRPDAWKLQLPFVCKPHETVHLDIRAAGLPDTVQARVVSAAYLSALGWSMNVGIRISGRLEIDQLIAFLNLLRDRNSRCFVMQGCSRSLAETHGALSEMLVRDVYPEKSPPADLRKVSRHTVLSVSEFQGPRQLYRRAGLDRREWDEMSAENRARMHSLLYGRPISVEHAEMQKIAYTQFDNANFALTEFDLGTLLFMQDMARSDIAPDNQRTLRCLSNNVSRCSMMILMWLHFYGSTADRTEPKVRTLRGFAPRTLKGLSESYTNRICQTFFRNHAGLQKVAFGAPAGDSAIDAPDPAEETRPPAPPPRTIGTT